MRLFSALSRRFNRNGGRKCDGKHENPSIADFTDKTELAAAMNGKRRGSLNGGSIFGSTAGSFGEDSSMSSFGEPEDITSVEWTLPLVDTKTSEPQTMEEEMKRLEVLNSYFVLDSKGEVEFDRITELGASLFDVPICLISLVDLGRQWFLSKVGIDATETARKYSFCAHTILNKYQIMVLPDASKDFRFKDNPFVTDGLKVRFYAGAALVSKEGYKLGTVCLVSPEVRPRGLNAKEQEILKKLAAMVISAMEARRTRLLKEEHETKFHALARTFLDTTQHLEEAKGCIEKVVANSSWGMDGEEYEGLTSAVQSLNMQSKMCTAAMRAAMQDTPTPNKSDEVDEEGCLDNDHFDYRFDTITDMKKLFDNINAIVANFPRQGTVTVELDKSIPKAICCDDLLLFRAILNMLTQCMGASASGEACAVRIRRMKREEDELLVQCLLGGKPVTKEAAKSLFDNRDSLLAPVASIVRSMGGHYGMYEARWDPYDTKSPTQSIFWFQVPYERPEVVEKFRRNLVKEHSKPEALAKIVSGTAVEHVNMDPFQKALLGNGCCGRHPSSR